jgi:hypothetical protein
LVTITIIGILAAMVLGAMHASGELAKEYATKSTIAKLNNIIMERYESYMTRRVPVDLSTDTSGNRLTPVQSAVDRLYAIRDLMRMELPDRQYDVMDDTKTAIPPIVLPYSKKRIEQPAIYTLFYTQMANAPAGNGNTLADVSAELLYMIVSIGSPESMEQFNQSEIGDVDGNRLPEFLDGWGRPISFLRWAPAFLGSDIQMNNANTQHDPFDSRSTEAAYQLIPLIYSSGPDGKPGLRRNGYSGPSSVGFYFANPSNDYATTRLFSSSEFPNIGEPSDNGGTGTLTYYHDNITNHHIEQR